MVDNPPDAKLPVKLGVADQHRLSSGRHMSTATELIERLRLQPHPEGGWYRQTWVSASLMLDGRPASTSILFLLEQGQRSHWHRVDAEELWIFQAGAPLRLLTSSDGEAAEVKLGTGVDEAPQHLVRTGEWQSAEAEGGWTLVACIVTPGFRFEGFELAPPGWEPQTVIPA